jgi:hypothetical protein
MCCTSAAHSIKWPEHHGNTTVTPPFDRDSSVSAAVVRLRQQGSTRARAASRAGASASAVYADSSASERTTNTHATSSLPAPHVWDGVSGCRRLTVLRLEGGIPRSTEREQAEQNAAWLKATSQSSRTPRAASHATLHSAHLW